MTMDDRQDSPLPLLDRFTWVELALLYGAWLAALFWLPTGWMLTALFASYVALACFLWAQEAHEKWLARMIYAVGFGAFYFSIIAAPIFMFGLPRESGTASGLAEDRCYDARGPYTC